MGGITFGAALVRPWAKGRYAFCPVVLRVGGCWQCTNYSSNWYLVCWFSAMGNSKKEHLTAHSPFSLLFFLALSFDTKMRERHLSLLNNTSFHSASSEMSPSWWQGDHPVSFCMSAVPCCCRKCPQNVTSPCILSILLLAYASAVCLQGRDLFFCSSGVCSWQFSAF